MPKYLVPITRDCTETTMVEVDADNREAARDQALSEVQAAHWEFNFVPDDGSGFEEPYFAGEDDLESIEEVK